MQNVYWYVVSFNINAFQYSRSRNKEDIAERKEKIYGRDYKSRDRMYHGTDIVCWIPTAEA